MTAVPEYPPAVGENFDLGSAWASTRLIPDLKTKKGKCYFGVFFTARETYAMVHDFKFSEEATRAAVAVQWDYSLGKLGIRPATMVGALAMLEHDHANRYRKGAYVRFYGRTCPILCVALANTSTVLHIDHPTAGTLRVAVDDNDNILEWESVELPQGECA